jgi:phospholipase/lecithinase/hemolysin
MLLSLVSVADAVFSGTPKPDAFASECGAKANEYFWLNGLHPTTPVHDALAYQAGRLLELSGIVSNALKNALGGKDRGVDAQEQVLD